MIKALPVEFHTCGSLLADMPVVTVMSVGMVVVIIVEYEVDLLGRCRVLDMGVLFIKRSIQVCSSRCIQWEIGLCCLPETQVVGGQDHRFPGWNLFGTILTTLKFNAASSNSFREITLRFQSDGNHRFCLVIVAFWEERPVQAAPLGGRH